LVQTKLTGTNEISTCINDHWFVVAYVTSRNSKLSIINEFLGAHNWSSTLSLSLWKLEIDNFTGARFFAEAEDRLIDEPVINWIN